jgi:hypothetical protein
MQFNLRRAMPLAMAIGLAATLAVSISWRVTADEDERSGVARCSNRTLRGDYGFSSMARSLPDRAPSLFAA